jgi:hypothetical protein
VAGSSRGETLDTVPGERLAPHGQMRAEDLLASEHRLDVATRDAGIRLAHDAQLLGGREATPPRVHDDLVRGLGGWRVYGWLGHDDQAPFSAFRHIDLEEVTVSGIVDT